MDTQDNQTRKYIFSVEEEPSGIKVGFNNIDSEGIITEDESALITTVDISMITIALFKMLKEGGLSDNDLKGFANNLLEETITSEVWNEDAQKK